MSHRLISFSSSDTLPFLKNIHFPHDMDLFPMSPTTNPAAHLREVPDCSFSPVPRKSNSMAEKVPPRHSDLLPSNRNSPLWKDR